MSLLRLQEAAVLGRPLFSLFSHAAARVQDCAALIMRAVAQGGASAAAPMREAALKEGAMLHHLLTATSGQVNHKAGFKACSTAACHSKPNQNKTSQQSKVYGKIKACVLLSVLHHVLMTCTGQVGESFRAWLLQDMHYTLLRNLIVQQQQLMCILEACVVTGLMVPVRWATCGTTCLPLPAVR